MVGYDLKMKKKFISFLFFALLLAGAGACVKMDDSGIKNFGYQYFPLVQGKYNIYQVTDSIFSLSAPKLTVNSYQVMELVSDTMTDLNKDKVYEIIRYSRKDPLTDWNLDSVWTARLMFAPGRQSFNRAVKTENNNAFVKLVFPVANNIKWNGNQLNSLNPPDSINQNNIYGTYKMVNVHRPYLKYDSTIFVIQNHDTLPNNQKWEKRTERYAANFGMIEKEKIYVEFACPDGVCSGSGEITFGYKTKYKLIKRGHQ